MEPITRSEQFLAAILGEDVVLPIPQSRIEYYLNAIAQNGIAPSSAGLINYDPDANYPDGSIGKEMHTLDGDVDQLKSAINEAEASFPQKSASGSIVTIEDGADNVPVVSLEAEINPVQDLHGYGNPWPAGGGKNKLPNPIAGTITKSGVTLTAYSDGTFSVSGTSTASETKLILFNLADSYVIPVSVGNGGQGCFYINNSFSGTGIAFHLYNGSTKVDEWGLTSTNRTSSTYAGMEGKTINKVGISFPSGATVSGTFAPMFTEDGSTTATYSPYSNLCPISGHSAVNVTHTGVFNLGADYTGDGFVSASFLTDTGSATSNTSFNISGYIPVEGNVPIFVNIEIDLNAPSICYYDSSKTFISGEKYNHRRTFTATTPANCAFVRMSVEMGHTADMGFYDHYTTISIPIGSTVYGGSLVLNQDGTADLTVDRRFITIDDNSNIGKEATGWAQNYEAFYLNVSGNVGKDVGVSLTPNIMSNQLKSVPYNILRGSSASAFSITFTASGSYIEWLSTSTTVEEEKARITNNPIEVCYELATPQTYHITDVEIIKTLLGLNNLWADTGGINLTYRADPSMYTAEQIQTMLNAMVAPVEASTTASKAYSINDFLILNNTLYKVISPISNGGTITINTNVSATTVGAELTAILNS